MSKISRLRRSNRSDSLFLVKRSKKVWADYRYLVEMAHDGITMVDAKDNLIFVNGQFARGLGYKVNDLIGRSLFSLATKESALRIAQEMERRKKGKKSRYEVILIHRNGTEKHFSLSASPMRDESYEFVGSVAVYSDITKRKALEWERTKKMKQMNALNKIHGIARISVLLSSVLNDVAKETVQALSATRGLQCRLVYDGKVYSHPRRLGTFFSATTASLVIDGVDRGVIEVGYNKQSSILANIDSFKEVRDFVSNVAKILRRHLYAREISVRYREMVKNSFSSIAITRSNKIIYANSRFYKMYRCKESQAIGHDIQIFLRYRNIGASGKTKIFEGQGKRMNGDVFDLAMVTQHIHYNGSPAVLVRINDTTALKKAQSRVFGSNSLLRKVVKEKTFHLEQANRRLRSLNRSKDEFIAITSHELRSPLTSIRGYLSFLVEEDSINQISEPYREYLMRAYSTTDSLNYLISNILDVSRLEMGRFELQKQEVDVMKLIRAILDSLSFQADEAKLQLEFENNIGCEHFMLEIDSIRMSQVLRNVLDNSIKFTKKGKKIKVTISCDSKWFTVAVSDQGVGIPKTKLNQVFDKFIQVRNTQTRYKGGVGLGLFISKRIVELHNGIIEAKKNEGGGITISMHLPLHH